jgi:hypothetical protein
MNKLENSNTQTKKMNNNNKLFTNNEIQQKRTNNFQFLNKKIQFRSKSIEELDILYQIHCEKVRNKYEKILKKHPNKNISMDRYIELKRCEACCDFINDKYMVLCDYCDDGYHIYCLNPPLEKIPRGVFSCDPCKKQLKLMKETEKIMKKNINNCFTSTNTGTSYRQTKVDEYNITFISKKLIDKVRFNINLLNIY